MNKWLFAGSLIVVYLITLRFSYGSGYSVTMSPGDKVTPTVTLSNVTNVTSVSPIMSPLMIISSGYYSSLLKTSPLSPSSRAVTSYPIVTNSVTPFVVPTKAISTKININTANLAELDKIPEVGPIIAQRIIDYRTTIGLFQKIEDIIKVKGIGDKTFENMKDQITVEP